MNPARNVHPMTYAICRKETSRALKVHHRRDAAAALELLPPLFALGFGFGEQIINQPPLHPNQADPRQRLVVDRSALRPGDLILQPTRPPLTDEVEDTMKQVERAYTDLEDDVLAAWKRVFCVCDRRRVKLQAEVLHGFRPGFENHATMQFCQREPGAPITFLKGSEPKAKRKHQPVHDRTVAFFYRVDEIYPGGPGLIGTFGIDGIANMVWAWHLRRDFAHLLTEPGFAILEMQIGDVPNRPTDLRWASTWKVTEILRCSMAPDLLRPEADRVVKPTARATIRPGSTTGPHA